LLRDQVPKFFIYHDEGSGFDSILVILRRKMREYEIAILNRDLRILYIFLEMLMRPTLVVSSPWMISKPYPPIGKCQGSIFRLRLPEAPNQMIWID